MGFLKHPQRAEFTAISQRLQGHLRDLKRDYPLVWKYVEYGRKAFGTDEHFTWPEWCFLPGAWAYSVVSNSRFNGREIPPTHIQDVARVMALAAWGMGKGVYVFDPDAMKALVMTPLDSEIPVKTFFRLPEWCVYISGPIPTLSGEDSMAGAYVHLEYDVQSHVPELRFLLDTKEGGFSTFQLHLDANTISDCIKNAIAYTKRFSKIQSTSESESHDIAYMSDVLTPLVSLVLYLCSDTADMPQIKPVRHTPKKTRKGLRVFQATNISLYPTGYRIGASLRAAHRPGNEHQPSDEAAGTTKAGHMRRAHWHSFWTGPRKTPEKQKLIVKWLPPIPVNLNPDETLPTFHL